MFFGGRAWTLESTLSILEGVVVRTKSVRKSHKGVPWSEDLQAIKNVIYVDIPQLGIDSGDGVHGDFTVVWPSQVAR
jgi:hypothetical protein